MMICEIDKGTGRKPIEYTPYTTRVNYKSPRGVNEKFIDRLRYTLSVREHGEEFWHTGCVWNKKSKKFDFEISVQKNGKFVNINLNNADNEFYISEAINSIQDLIDHIEKLEREKAWLAEQCVKFGDKSPRESTEYWLNAARRSV